MKAWIAAVTMIAALTATTQATTHAEMVAGTVVDAATNRPLAGAIVTVTFAPRVRPLRTKTDEAGRFTLVTTETPAYVTVTTDRFETFTMALSALAPSVMENLRIPLNRKLTPVSVDVARSACAAWQPMRIWVTYVMTPNGCGRGKF